jgi:hypothetical protein
MPSRSERSVIGLIALRVETDAVVTILAHFENLCAVFPRHFKATRCESFLAWF